MSELAKSHWNTIVRQTARGKLLPIVSARVTHKFVFDHPEFMQAWSEDMGYPLGSSLSITRLAQYLSVTVGDDSYKKEFLDFTKRHLRKSVAAAGADDEKQADIKDKLDDLNLSDLIAQIKPAVLEDHVNNPLRALAGLPIPVYITTCYFDLLEKALERAGKRPHPQTYHSNKEASPIGQEARRRLHEEMVSSFNLQDLEMICFDLEDVDSDDVPGDSRRDKARELIMYMENRKRLPDLVTAITKERPNFDVPPELVSLEVADPDYQPSTEDPLVYHVFGMEEEPQSLVLSEDDYLRFLIDWAQDTTQKEFISLDLYEALQESSLILLGYDLQDWDFRVLFHSLIGGKRQEKRPMSVAIQLSPEVEKDDEAKAAQEFIERYLDKEGNFQIYWGSVESFLEELSERREKET